MYGFLLTLSMCMKLEDCSWFRFSSVAPHSSPYENGMPTIHTHTLSRTHARKQAIWSQIYGEIIIFKEEGKFLPRNMVFNGIIWLCRWHWHFWRNPAECFDRTGLDSRTKKKTLGFIRSFPFKFIYFSAFYWISVRGKLIWQ